MAKHDILGFFEHRRDGAWICVRPFTLTTPNASVDIRQGMRFDYGKRVGVLTSPNIWSGWARSSAPDPALSRPLYRTGS